MKVIKTGSERVIKSWGIQKKKQTEYRLIKYLLSESTPDGTLLLNTVTGSIVILDKAEEEIIKKLPLEYSAGMDALIEKGGLFADLVKRQMVEPEIKD